MTKQYNKCIHRNIFLFNLINYSFKIKVSQIINKSPGVYHTAKENP